MAIRDSHSSLSECVSICLKVRNHGDLAGIDAKSCLSIQLRQRGEIGGAYKLLFCRAARKQARTLQLLRCQEAVPNAIEDRVQDAVKLVE